VPHHRRSPPSYAARRRPSARVHPQPPDRDPTLRIDLTAANRHCLHSSRRRPLDLDPTGWIRSYPSQYQSNRLYSAFLRESPCVSQFYKYVLPQQLVSSQLDPFVTFSPRTFRFLYSLVLTSSLVRILVALAPFLAFFISTRSSRSVEQFYISVLCC
jgi:hypothetical protein